MIYKQIIKTSSYSTLSPALNTTPLHTALPQQKQQKTNTAAANKNIVRPLQKKKKTRSDIRLIARWDFGADNVCIKNNNNMN